MTLDAPKINKRKRHSYFVRHHLRKRSEQTAFGFGFDSGIPSFVVVVGLRPGLLITHLKNDKSADKRENRKASVPMQRLSYLTETVLHNKVTIHYE